MKATMSQYFIIFILSGLWIVRYTIPSFCLSSPFPPFSCCWSMPSDLWCRPTFIVTFLLNYYASVFHSKSKCHLSELKATSNLTGLASCHFRFSFHWHFFLVLWWSWRAKSKQVLAGSWFSSVSHTKSYTLLVERHGWKIRLEFNLL